MFDFRVGADDDARACRPLLLGFGFGVIGTLAWCVWTGLPLWFSLADFGFYLATALVAVTPLSSSAGQAWG